MAGWDPRWIGSDALYPLELGSITRVDVCSMKADRGPDWLLSRSMCGRYTLTNPDPARMRARFDILESVEADDPPRFNIAPTDPVLAVRRLDGRRELGRLRWGLLPGRWAERKGARPLINARAETLLGQPAFAEAFRRRRCLIPADGFYEWLSDERGKRPVWFSRLDAGLFAFAGLWTSLERADGEPLHSCTIVTCPPNEEARAVHDRMPVVLAADAEADWLDPDGDPDDLLNLLVPAAEGTLVAREVSDLVNDVREDGPALIAPREQQRALF